MKKKLTAKQKLFVKEYIVDLNATQAAIRAGYKGKAIRFTAHKLLTNHHISDAIEKEKALRRERVDINADYVLNRLIAIDRMDVSEIMNDDFSIKSLSEWPESWRRTVSGIDVASMSSSEENEISLLKKIKWPDKVKNLELIGRHVDVKAWYEKDTGGAQGAEKIAQELHDLAENLKV